MTTRKNNTRASKVRGGWINFKQKLKSPEPPKVDTNIF